MKFDGFGLLGDFSDFRRAGQGDTAIFSPVGSEKQLDEFVSHVRRLGIDKEADFVFIMRPGIKPARTGLSELRCHEIFPLGTSGCFFAGQALCLQLGYETIVVADLDAFLDSRATFDAMTKFAKEKKCAVVPLSRQPGAACDKNDYFVMNQWGVFPRSVFEKAGVANPYTARGGEDWELAQRLDGLCLLHVYREGAVSHPRNGATIYEKMSEPGKFYPYVGGLMKAFLLCAKYRKSAYVKYAAWRLFYSFFADAFGDGALLAAVETAHLAKTAKLPEGAPKVQVRGSAGPAAGRLAGLAASLFALLMRGEAVFCGTHVALLVPKDKLRLGLVAAAMLVPVRLAQSAAAVVSWQKASKGLPYPATLQNYEEVAKAYAKIIS